MNKKNIIEDIKPLSRERPAEKTQKETLVRRAPPLPREIPFEPQEPKPTSRYALWYIAVICVVGLLLSISFLFEHATVTVTPRLLPVAFDASDSFTADKDSTEPDVIVYTVMRLSGSETIRLPSTASKVLSDHALGAVTLYNAYTKGTVTVPKNTALQSTDGRVYLTNKSVTIPGYKVGTGNTIVPGSITVAAAAVVSGESGNLASGSFTLPKYAKLPQAKKIYASVLTPFSGGASGTVYTIPKNTGDDALATLSDKLKASLISKARVQVPDGYLFYNGATIFSPDPSVQVSYSKEPEVPVILSGTLVVYLLKQDTLVKAIASRSISQYDGEYITIPKLPALSLTPKAGIAYDPDADTAFDFTFSGSADILWTIDKKEIAGILASVKKSDFETVIGTVSGVEKAQVVVRPFWERSFPKNPDQIDVIVVPPSAKQP